MKRPVYSEEKHEHEEFYRSLIKQRQGVIQRRIEAKKSIRSQYADELKGLDSAIDSINRRRHEIYQQIETEISRAMVQIQ